MEAHRQLTTFKGLARSLALAAWEADRCEAEALLVLLADMPLVSPTLLAALAARPAPAATDHGGRRPGVPALFPRALFGELTKLEGDRGAARLLAHLPGLVLVQAELVSLLDIDSEADLTRAHELQA